LTLGLVMGREAALQGLPGPRSAKSWAQAPLPPSRSVRSRTPLMRRWMIDTYSRNEIQSRDKISSRAGVEQSESPDERGFLFVAIMGLDYCVPPPPPEPPPPEPPEPPPAPPAPPPAPPAPPAPAPPAPDPPAPAPEPAPDPVPAPAPPSPP
jgi:hypothetical protein